MRYRFPDPDDAREAKLRAKKARAIDAWWKAFAAKADDFDALFSRKKTWDIARFMSKYLGAIDKRLMWEFGPALSGKGHRLVITSEQEEALRPLVDLVLSRAPKVRRFELLPYRPAEPLDMVEPTVRGRLGRELPAMRVVVTEGEHHTIDLRFLVEGCRGEDDADAGGLAFVVAETLLGEQVLDVDVGHLSVGPLKRVRGAVELPELHRTVTRALAARRKALPARPCAARRRTAEWSLIKNEPQPQDDYGHQLDIFVAVTMWTSLWMATHSDIPFHSSRFSRHGELFAFVKIDGLQGLSGSDYEDREDVENAIAKAMGKHGAVVGGGTGLRYSYVELALTNPEKALPAIRKALRAGRIPKRTWILFHDAPLADEWLGIYPKTPRPPG